MLELSKFLPVTVIAAIFLFLIKEIFEAFKKRSERNRKLSAYKILLAEETSKNAWSIFTLRMVVDRLRDPSFAVEVVKNSDGSCNVKTSKGEEWTNGVALLFHSSVFDKHIVDLAVLNNEFFLQMKVTYQALAEAKVSRLTMLEMCVDTFYKPILSSYLDGVVMGLDATESHVKKTYEVCTGKQLDSHKPTSFV